MRRVTLLDEEFRVIVTYCTGGLAPAEVVSEECQLLRTAELVQLAQLAGAA